MKEKRKRRGGAVAASHKALQHTAPTAAAEVLRFCGHVTGITVMFTAVASAAVVTGLVAKLVTAIGMTEVAMVLTIVEYGILAADVFLLGRAVYNGLKAH